MLRAFYQQRLRLERQRASPLGTNQGARNIESVLRQQLVEAVTGNAALYFRKARADQVAVFVGKGLEPGVNLRLPSARRNDARKLGLVGGPYPEPRAVVGEYFQRRNVLRSLAGHHRVRAAGVVAYHAAQRAAAVRGRVGAEGELVHLGGIAQRVADRPGLDQRGARNFIHRQHAIEVLGTVDDHGNIDALAVLRSAAAAREQGHAVPAAHRNRRFDVGDRTRQHHAYGHLAVIRGVGGIHRTHGLVKTHFPGYGRAQLGRQGFVGNCGIGKDSRHYGQRQRGTGGEAARSVSNRLLLS